MSIFSLKNIQKHYSHKIALAGVDLVLKSGEIHSLLGENGAGKSTLASILSGDNKASFGEFYLNGNEVFISSSKDAMSYGVYMVHQTPLISSNLRVWQNIILGHEKSYFGILNSKKVKEEISEIAKKWNISIDLQLYGKNLVASQRFYVALLAVLYKKPDFLILDEPCASLDSLQRASFYENMQKNAKNGQSILVITHSMEEAAKYSDKITILKKGACVASLDNSKKQVTEEDLHNILFSHSDYPVSEDFIDIIQDKKISELNTQISCQKACFSCDKNCLFEVKNLNTKPLHGASLFDISFKICSGQIVFIAGVRESGMETLEDIITGFSNEPYTASFFFNKKETNYISLKQLREFGTGIIPFDRNFRASNPSLSVKDILCSMYTGTDMKGFADSIIKNENIEINSNELASSLSGGMLQRLILARELTLKPKLLILSEPLQGLDVLAAEKLISILEKEVINGVAILILGSYSEFLARHSTKVFRLVGGKLSHVSCTFSGGNK